MLLWISFATSNIKETQQKSESTFKVWDFWMIQNFTHLWGEKWRSEFIGFWMMFPTLIFNRSLSLIDSCFQRTVNLFSVYSPLSLLQTILILACFFSFLVCYVWVLTLSFFLSIVVKYLIWTASALTMRILCSYGTFWEWAFFKILKRNPTFRHRTKHWKVEPKTNKH